MTVVTSLFECVSLCVCVCLSNYDKSNDCVGNQIILTTTRRTVLPLIHMWQYVSSFAVFHLRNCSTICYIQLCSQFQNPYRMHTFIASISKNCCNLCCALPLVATTSQFHTGIVRRGVVASYNAYVTGFECDLFL